MHCSRAALHVAPVLTQGARLGSAKPRSSALPSQRVLVQRSKQPLLRHWPARSSHSCGQLAPAVHTLLHTFRQPPQNADRSAEAVETEAIVTGTPRRNRVAAKMVFFICIPLRRGAASASSAGRTIILEIDGTPGLYGGFFAPSILAGTPRGTLWPYLVDLSRY